MPQKLKTLADRIRYLRKKAGLTLEQFGELCQVSKGYISHLERGRHHNPSGMFLELLSNGLGVDRAWIETGQGKPPEVLAVNPNMLNYPHDLKSGPVVIHGYQPESHAFNHAAIRQPELERFRGVIEMMAKGLTLNEFLGKMREFIEHGGPYRNRLAYVWIMIEVLFKTWGPELNQLSDKLKRKGTAD
jgi:transcriptional regulator with XRE-family HTH domain